MKDESNRLARLGLSESGVLHSTGRSRHLARLAAGEINADELNRYVADLETIQEAVAQIGTPISIDYWDVRSPAMEAVGLTEYALAYRLAEPAYRPYLELLGRSYGRLVEFKRGAGITAVATALDMLVDCAGYVRDGQPTHMVVPRKRLGPEGTAILLWQQIVAGTTRIVHGREVYTHSFWGRFNVVEMWSYETQTEESVTEVWGLSGFDNAFIRDPHNTNQIEHMAISAVAQRALGIPLFVLNLLEDVEWLTRRCSLAECQGDQALNRAVARNLCRIFTLDNPQTARDRMEKVLSGAR
jgi:hypothetical protein